LNGYVYATVHPIIEESNQLIELFEKMETEIPSKDEVGKSRFNNSELVRLIMALSAQEAYLIQELRDALKSRTREVWNNIAVKYNDNSFELNKYCLAEKHFTKIKRKRSCDRQWDKL